jgi:soluble lytic murein transglycosylase-like protein
MPPGYHAMSQEKLSMLVAEAAHTYHVRPELVQAVIDAESRGDPAAVSRAGAQGLMQLMPATSEQYGVFNPFDPQSNVDGGTHYLADLLRRYRGDLRLALAAYNAGPGAVAAAHGVPHFVETQAYVARVTAALR